MLADWNEMHARLWLLFGRLIVEDFVERIYEILGLFDNEIHSSAFYFEHFIISSHMDIFIKSNFN